MEADWDLLAVVRGCTTSSTTTASAASQAADLQQNLPPPPPPRFSSGFEDLQDLYTPFFPNLKCSISTPPFAGGFIREHLKLPQRAPQQQILFQQQQHPQQVKESHLILGSTSSRASVSAANSIITSSQSQRNSLLCAPTTTTSTTSQIQQKPKKRKNLQKRVCHVPAEGLSSDMWAWRKYGQKPIKGSPYPRGYYRCSSSKGCPARKQVERNRANPKMFIVTYTAEHNHPMPTHRNSLAGSTRQKPAATSSGNGAAATESPSTDNEHPAGSSSPAAEIKTEQEEEEEFDDMVWNDDFFVGFEELDDTVADGFSDQIQVDFPWIENTSSSSSSTAATAGGGS